VATLDRARDLRGWLTTPPVTLVPAPALAISGAVLFAAPLRLVDWGSPFQDGPFQNGFQAGRKLSQMSTGYTVAIVLLIGLALGGFRGR
jgi:hypothetical protein